MKASLAMAATILLTVGVFALAVVLLVLLYVEFTVILLELLARNDGGLT